MLDAGANNGYPPTNLNPISIRGYDTAGNLLSVIRTGGPVPFTNTRRVYWDSYGDGSQVHEFTERQFIARDQYGTPKIVATALVEGNDQDTSAAGMAIYESPRLIHALADGRVFCFCSLRNGLSWNSFFSLYDAAETPTIGPMTRCFIEPFRCYDRNGYRLNAPFIGGEAECFTLDAEGCIYVGGIAIFTHLGIAPPRSGVFLYAQGQDESALGLGPHVLRKHAPDGSLIWAIPGEPRRTQISDPIQYMDGVHSSIMALQWGADGGLYAVGSGGFDQKFRVLKINPATGAEVWRRVITADISHAIEYGLTLVPGPDALYACSQPSGLGTGIVKLRYSDGQVLASTFGDFGITYPAGLCIAGGSLHHFSSYQSGGNPNNHRTFSLTDLSLISAIPFFDYTLRRSSAGSDGSIYFSGPRFNTTRPSGSYSTLIAYHFRAIHADSTPLWNSKIASAREGTNSFGELWIPTYYPDDPAFQALISEDPYGRKVSPDEIQTVNGYPQDFWHCSDVFVVENTQIPALGLPLFCADPQSSLLILRPSALPLGLGLGLAQWRREYIGSAVLPTRYRLRLQAPNLADCVLNFSSLSIEVEAQTVRLVCVVPGLSLALAESIIDRRSGILTVQRGVRFLDSIEQIDSWLSAPLQRVRYDAGPASLSLTLEARGVVAYRAPESRTLKGIRQWQWQSQFGRRVYQCSPDPVLQPGDQVLIGSGSFLVGKIDCQITPFDAVMTVTEAVP